MVSTPCTFLFRLAAGNRGTEAGVSVAKAKFVLMLMLMLVQTLIRLKNSRSCRSWFGQLSRGCDVAPDDKLE